METAQSTSVKSRPVRSLVRDSEPDELREVIAEPCRLSKENRQFPELCLQGSDPADPGPIVTEAKEKIGRACHGPGRFPKLDKTGLGPSKTFADVSEGFHRSPVSMYGSFSREALRHPEWDAAYEEEIRYIQSLTGYMELGYENEIDRIAAELAREIPVPPIGLPSRQAIGKFRAGESIRVATTIFRKYPTTIGQTDATGHTINQLQFSNHHER